MGGKKPAKIPSLQPRLKTVDLSIAANPARVRDDGSGSFSHLYSHRRWRTLRAQQLEREPLCRMCSAQDRTTVATVCDHVEPHRGDMVKFWSGPFQSLCKACHDGDKQRQEKSRPGGVV